MRKKLFWCYIHIYLFLMNKCMTLSGENIFDKDPIMAMVRSFEN